jgi:superfamily II RNA helicase
MGSRELIITEMVLDGVLDNKQPSEIAALLSCLVFQQKTRAFQHRKQAEPQLTEKLVKVYHSSRSPPLPDLPLDAGQPTFFVVQATLSTFGYLVLIQETGSSVHKMSAA